MPTTSLLTLSGDISQGAFLFETAAYLIEAPLGFYNPNPCAIEQLFIQII
ncbi:hypothetical protein [Marinomonas sp.]